MIAGMSLVSVLGGRSSVESAFSRRDWMRSEHLAHREFFVESQHPAVGVLKYPGSAYKLSNSPLPLAARPAPLLGEHNSEILEGLR